jgi:AcrR family transcriptional regulator
MVSNKNRRRSYTNTNLTVAVLPRKMSKDPLKSKIIREQVFHAIAKTMLKRRTGVMTLDDIAATAGRSKGTIYYYFKSKGEMLYDMTRHVFGLLAEAVSPILGDKALQPKERLEKAVHAHMMVSCQNSDLVRAIWSDLSLRELRAGLGSAVTRSRHRYEKQITELIEEVMQTEGWSCPNPKIAMRMIFSIINGISLWYREDGKLSPEQMSDYAVRCILKGVFEGVSVQGIPKLLY